MVKNISRRKKVIKKIDGMMEKNLNNRIMTIPNVLTIIRILLVPIIFVLIMKNNYSLGISLAVFAAVTDLLDGYIARKYNMGSSIGKTLDPLADKIIIFSLILLAIIKFNFPIWLSIIIISRDIMIVLGGLAIIILNREYRVLLSPNIYGKLSTFMQFTTIIIYLFAKSSGLYSNHVLAIIVLLYLTCAVTLFSGIMYIVQGYTILKQHRLSKSNSKNAKKINLANIFTISRILFIIPFIVLLESNVEYKNYFAAGLFILLSLSDLLDGYIARKRKETTDFGAMLDPLADKLLVSSALVFLIGKGIDAWMVYAILARELLVTGLRTLAADKGRSMPVKMSGKIKTTSQMIAISTIILQIPYSYYIILAATIITIYSGIEYFWIERKLLKESLKSS